MNKEQIKKAVRKRDGKCIRCGKTNDENISETGVSLDVHRRVPGSKYTVKGCVSLCRKCHSETHSDGELIDEQTAETVMTDREPFTFRLNDLLREGLDKLATRNASMLTGEIIIAIRTHLERNNLWPVEE